MRPTVTIQTRLLRALYFTVLLAYPVHLLLHLVTNPWVQFLLGLIVIGPLLSSWHESCVHEYVGHARPPTREFWKRHPRLMWPFMEGFFLHHVVHHGKTYSDGYLEQFGGRLTADSVDAWVPEAFYRLFAEQDQTWIRKKIPPHVIIQHVHFADYGLGAVSGVRFGALVWPLVAFFFLIAPFWMAVGAMVPMLIILPMMSNVIHRNMMHVSQDGTISERHGPNRGLLVGTRYLQALERWHWMHHEYIYCNYNLFVLADYFRGARRKPSPKDLEKMQAEGLVMGRHYKRLNQSST